MGALADLINFFLVSALIFFGAWYVTNHTSFADQENGNSEQDASTSKARSKKKNAKKKKSKQESTAPESAPALSATAPAAAKPAAATRGVDALEQLRAERRAEMAAAMPEYTRELEERRAAEEAERQVLS
jgi:cytoskeletal protein RodZ